MNDLKQQSLKAHLLEVLDHSNFALKKGFWKFQFSNAHNFFDPSTKIWYFELFELLFII
jgi:hypothetical protein